MSDDRLKQLEDDVRLLEARAYAAELVIAALLSDTPRRVRLLKRARDMLDAAEIALGERDPGMRSRAMAMARDAHRTLDTFQDNMRKP